jgi:hypothetical protein
MRTRPAPTQSELRGWFAGRLPESWFVGAPDVAFDREEIIVVGRVTEPDVGDDPEARAAACQTRITTFREDTRALRMRIADEAETRYGRKVAWGARCGDAEELFTTLSAPVMTRLRMPERQILDTLVDAGIARSRSHALAWCVRLVGDHEGEWIGQLRDALVEVEKLRAEGPTQRPPTTTDAGE